MAYLTPVASADQRYDFCVRTRPGLASTHSANYPIFVRDTPDWSAFARQIAALEADHLTLIADASLPPEVIASVYAHLSESGIPCLLLSVEVNEQRKTLETALRIASQARSNGGGTHQSCFVSLGGGVLGNVAGLAAALLVRGVRLVHIPTTLLAATDSILSLKQGVNVPDASGHLIKNLVGTFYAPELAFVYLSFWRTLPDQEIRAGLCELVKNVVGIHPERIAEVAALLRPDARYSIEECQRIFALCFAAKQEIMQQDAHEKGPALILELGHTFGHALESHTGLSHGLAIGLGMLVAARISVARGLLSCAEEAQLLQLLIRNGAPTTLPADLDVDAILNLMRADNKIGYLPQRPGSFVMVLLEHFGRPVMEQGLPLTYVAEAEVRAAIADLQACAFPGIELFAAQQENGGSHEH
jgi:3-dehydroquinate synthase/2-deoxy-scyllo-inosose synthase